MKAAARLSRYIQITRRLLRRSMHALRPGSIRFTGPYDSWAEARKHSCGYSHGEIIDRVHAAAMKVKRGEAAYERDGVVFTTPAFNHPLLSGLLLAASENGGALSVMDFGGSLGSTYFQHRAFLSGVKGMRWSIVEQMGFVECGRKDFQDEVLRFYPTMEECLASENPNVILLSSVLQYLDDPYAVIRSLPQCAAHLIIDMLPVWDGPGDKHLVQRVGPQIYSASYPFRMFSDRMIGKALATTYTTLSVFDSIHFPALEAVNGHYIGMILRRA